MKRVTPKPAVRNSQSKPKSKLSKSDPDYYSKIGTISARKRKLPKTFFSAMAKKSHKNRTVYNGGRRKKQDSELAQLDKELKTATE